jgi:Family of unknown function (DUF6356)
VAVETHIAARGTPLGTQERGLFERIFLEHPRSFGESYWGHQRRALEIGTLMIAGGVACFIHALMPVLFKRTGSNTIRHLYENLILKRGIDPVTSSRES